MEDEQRQVAKEHMIALMQAGHSWREAATRAGIQTSRAAAYRLLQNVRTRGEAALQDPTGCATSVLREVELA